MNCTYNGPRGPLFLTLTDHQLTVTYIHPALQSSVYYLPDGVDWAHVDGLLQEQS